MARLLPAQAGLVLLHHLQNIFVAYRSAQHADAAAAQCRFQAHVRHGRRHHQIAGQLGLGLHIAGRHQHHPVPIDHPAVGVGKQRAVGIPIEGDPQVGAQRLGLPGHDFRMQGAAVFVDIASVGGYVRQVNLAAQAKRKSSDAMTAAAPLAQSITIFLPAQVQPGNNVAQKGLVFLAEILARRGCASGSLRSGGGVSLRRRKISASISISVASGSL